MKLNVVVVFLLFVVFSTISSAEDFYQLLGITKSATQRDIRRAFKRLALEKHPDKRSNDADAHAEFVRINRAYEILRDDELRKKYDTYGEDGLKEDFNRGNQYQSWNFYQQNFGIYDEDAEIITLSRADFLQSVDGSQDVWFINFYSPQCSHCHDLAPVWREISKILEGVVRIGAVNCQDEWMMCNEQGIQAFPTLRIYPKRDVFQGPRDKEVLVRYAMSFVSANVVQFDDRMIENFHMDSKTPWLIVFCREIDENDCLDDDQIYKLAAIFNNLVRVGSVDCRPNPNVCRKFNAENQIEFYSNETRRSILSSNSNLKEIVAEIFSFLPDISLLDEENFSSTIKTKPSLVHFVDKVENEKDFELKKLPFLLPDFNVKRVDCSKSSNICDEFFVSKRPNFVLFKSNGFYEFYYGRQTANDVASFARENAFSTLRTLTPNDFPHVKNDEKPLIIDFFSPFCPPCLHFLPEFRKASKRLNGNVNFALVDCSIHNPICQQSSVQSYPTTILYNQSTPHFFNGQHREESIIEFIEEILHPSVISLNDEQFLRLVEQKTFEEMWLIDFFMPWCFPCQQLSGEWRKLAKVLKDIANVAQVDCSTETSLCQRQGVQSYPTIRLYTPNTDGSNYVVYPNNAWRDVNSLRNWAFQYLPSKVTEIDGKSFSTMILRDSKPWLVDFYAPWCGHCHHFAPIYETIARKLDGQVNLAKINCDVHRDACQRASIRAYPTVRFYRGSIDSKRQDFLGEEILNLDADFIVNFVLEKQRDQTTSFHHSTEL